MALAVMVVVVAGVPVGVMFVLKLLLLLLLLLCGTTVFPDLRREPTRFFKRAFIDDMKNAEDATGLNRLI